MTTAPQHEFGYTVAMASGLSAKERYAAEKAAPLLARAAAAYRAHDLVNAERLVESALRFQPAAPVAQVLRAAIAFARGNYAVAADGFGKALAARPEDRETAANLAVALSRLGKDADCYDVLRAHAPWNDRPDCELLLIQSALASGAGTNDEIAGFIEALEVRRPNDVAVVFLRGILEERRARWQESLAAFSRTAELSNDVVGLSEALRVAMRIGEADRLEALADRARRRLASAPDAALTANLAAIEVMIGRDSEAEERVLIERESHEQSHIAWNSRIDRLIIRGDFAGAVDMLATAMSAVPPASEPANATGPPPHGAQTPIARLIVHNGHHLLRPLSADDVAEACGLPVRLLDLNAVPPSEFAAADTLVIYASGITATQAPIVRTIKAVNPDCPVVAWHFDNHHSYVWNALLAAASDLSFPAHATAIDYLPRWSARARCGGIVPLCVMQWPRPRLAELSQSCRGEPRSDALSGSFAFYPIAAKRNHFVAEINRQWPEAQLSVTVGGYHRQSERERFLSWRRYKTSLALPVMGDLSNRFFDALAAGQVPIVPRDILDFDRVIPPAEQDMLPIIRLEEYSLDALRAAHTAAIAAFDRGGEAQAERRHRFVLERHMIAHRISEIAARAAAQLGRTLARAAA